MEKPKGDSAPFAEKTRKKKKKNFLPCPFLSIHKENPTHAEFAAKEAEEEKRIVQGPGNKCVNESIIRPGGI
jgi:hypothetical protein